MPATARFDPEQNDNTWLCAGSAQTHLKLSPEITSKSEASSFRDQLLRPCGTPESGLPASITRKRHLQPHASVITRHRYDELLLGCLICIPSLAVTHPRMLWRVNTSGHHCRNINMRARRVPLKRQRPSAGPPVPDPRPLTGVMSRQLTVLTCSAVGSAGSRRSAKRPR